MNLSPIALLLVLQAEAGVSPAGIDAPIAVRCVEARTASVFAGACHYGAELTTAGREALIVWQVESGAHAGVDLAGVDLVAAISGVDNLADPRTDRKSIVYVSDRATPAQRGAAADLFRSLLGVRLGRVLAVEAVPLAAEFDGDHYRVDGGSLFRIEGALLPDRACCKMPLAVWYQPLSPLRAPIVGKNALVRFSDPRLGPVWERFDENTGLYGFLDRRPRGPSSGE